MVYYGVVCEGVKVITSNSCLVYSNAREKRSCMSCAYALMADCKASVEADVALCGIFAILSTASAFTSIIMSST